MLLIKICSLAPLKLAKVEIRVQLVPKLPLRSLTPLTNTSFFLQTLKKKRTLISFRESTGRTKENRTTLSPCLSSRCRYLHHPKSWRLTDSWAVRSSLAGMYKSTTASSGQIAPPTVLCPPGPTSKGCPTSMSVRTVICLLTHGR